MILIPIMDTTVAAQHITCIFNAPWNGGSGFTLNVVKIKKMDFDLGVFKSLFLIESFFGLTTVNVRSLGQCRVKVVYCWFIVIVQIIEFALYVRGQIVYYNHPEELIYIFVWLVFALFNILVTVNSISDWNQKMSIALQMQAIAQNLESKDDFFDKLIIRGAFVSFVVFFTLRKFAVFTYIVPREVTIIPAIPWFTSPYRNGSLIIQGAEEIIFLTKFVSLKRNILKEMDSTVQSLRDPHSQGATRSNSKDEIRNRNSKLRLYISLQNALYQTLNDVQEQFRAFLVFMRFYIEVKIILSYVVHGTLLNTVREVTSALMFLGMVIASERVYATFKDTKQQLATVLFKSNSKSQRRIFKHQMLSNIHRSSRLSCRLFVLDYGLIAEVLENTAWVLIAVLGSRS